MTDATVSNAVASLLSVPRGERWKLAVRGTCRRVAEEVVAAMTDAQADAQPDPLLDGDGTDKPNELTAETARLMALCDREYREVADTYDRALSDAWTRKVDAEILGVR